LDELGVKEYFVVKWGFAGVFEKKRMQNVVFDGQFVVVCVVNVELKGSLSSGLKNVTCF
jgi:hypothetical protein